MLKLKLTTFQTINKSRKEELETSHTIPSMLENDLRKDSYRLIRLANFSKALQLISFQMIENKL